MDVTVRAGMATPPLAGRINAFWSIGLDQGQRPQTGAEALFRMRTVCHHHLAKGGYGWAGLCRLRRNFGGRPLTKSAMCGGHMVGHSHMIAPPRGAHMTRNPLASMTYLDGPAADANVDLLFDQGEGHGIP